MGILRPVVEVVNQFDLCGIVEVSLRFRLVTQGGNATGGSSKGFAFQGGFVVKPRFAQPRRKVNRTGEYPQAAGVDFLIRSNRSIGFGQGSNAPVVDQQGA